MDAHLRAGVAIYNAGGYHAAHDAWEDHWLALESGTDDERFLHGLIQFTAAVHHGGRGNWEGVRGLAESAGGYLEGLPSTYRGVDLEPVRTYLEALAEDPEHVERVEPPSLRVDGEAPWPHELDFPAATVAAEVLAEERTEYDESVVEDAVAYARDAVESGEDGRFVALVMDFVGDANRRGLVYERLVQHVERRRARESDVEGLFEEGPDGERG